MMHTKNFMYMLTVMLLIISAGMVYGTDDLLLLTQNKPPTSEISNPDVADDSSSETSSRVQPPLRNYLFIQDVSKNMRRRKRIPIMQASIRAILDRIPPESPVGLRTFGHRFDAEGPDACEDTDVLVSVAPLSGNREDFEGQLTLLSEPQIGGGAPVGLALKQGIADVQSLTGPKDLYLYIADLQKCPDENTVEIIKSACAVTDLHLTLIGFGLRQDLRALEDANIHTLGCVDIVNLNTQEETDRLPDKLLTRFRVEFRNAENQLVDPLPGGNLSIKLFRKTANGKLEPVQEKIKNLNVRGTSVETVGLNEGTYLMDASYEGQEIRTQQEIALKAKEEVQEIIRLGRMMIEVTDSTGKPIDDPVGKQLEITLTDSGNVVRTIKDVANVNFDLLPGNQYQVSVSYLVGGKPQTFAYQDAVTINEGNHKKVVVALPIGSLSGRLLNMQGQPAPKIQVSLSESRPAKPAAAKPHIAVTDERGVYRFPDIRSGVYDLLVDVPGFKQEKQPITLIGGALTTVEDLKLFHGIEVALSGASGDPIPQAEVVYERVNAPTTIPISYDHNAYRNAETLAAGEYRITVNKPGYLSASKTVSLHDEDASVEIAIQLSYYVTLTGHLLNGKGEPIPDATAEFHNLNSAPETPENGNAQLTTPDGAFAAKIIVSGTGNEEVTFHWQDMYNQDYARKIAFTLPTTPQEVALGDIRLPINFVRVNLHDITGDALTADTVTLYQKQSSQSGIKMTLLEPGKYESTALPDGEYAVRVGKRGYQDVEQTLSAAGGTVEEMSVALRNYVTVIGTVVNGRRNRIPGATIAFTGERSTLASLQPIVTGKDGRFQATLLVNTPGDEAMTITWKSPDSGRTYGASAALALPKTPVNEFQPIDLGESLLPVNFARIEVQDTSKKGLPGVQIRFISNQGVATDGIELGDGLYESFDLPDGFYNIAISKPGYKEHSLISDVAVGKEQRDVRIGPVILSHYAVVTGAILNGNGEGLPNVDVVFGKTASEQLERCQTDAQGKFTTTILVTGAGQERWQATWKQEIFSESGVFKLPAHPNEAANLGEIRLPINFLFMPIEDVRGRPLQDVKIDIAYSDGTPLNNEEFSLEEVEPGRYDARNLPNGTYTVFLTKDGYELDKKFDVTVRGGERKSLKPLKLGHYVTVTGAIINGKDAPVEKAAITIKGLASRWLSDSQDALTTNSEGVFTAKLLVTQAGSEEIVASWGKNFSAVRQLDLIGEPGHQDLEIRLPMNFVTVNLTDNSGKPLSDAIVTLTHQTEKIIFPLEHITAGVYQSQEIPDGTYVVSAGKDRYESQTGLRRELSRTLLTVQNGMVRQASFALNHYITVKGYALNGKKKGVSAAVVTFGNQKCAVTDKIVSGTDGAFEAELLVKEAGRETGEINWVGKHGTYTTAFWIDLPPQPSLITLPDDQTRLPINFISLEVKSVAATGVPGASVRFTHRESGQIVDAQDLDNGNYEGSELPNGVYDVTVNKDQYQETTVAGIAVANGEHNSNVLVTKFPHYITMSGVVVNGKGEGVSGAVVSVQDPQKLQGCDPFTTREDGSFTLHALVTDMGTETLRVVWNTVYTTTLSLSLPSVPQHRQLETIKLPMNYISVHVQDVFGKAIPGAAVSFVEKDAESKKNDSGELAEVASDPAKDAVSSTQAFLGKEAAEGTYESPDLPDNNYVLVVRKAGYIQDQYPVISVKAGVNISDVALTMPHLVTLSGRVINGKNVGVEGVNVRIEGKNSRMSAYQLTTDASGYFSEQLEVTGTGAEALSLTKNDSARDPNVHFDLSQEIALPGSPGEQSLGDLRLPINFIPIQVQDVSGKAIADAAVTFVSANQPTNPPDIPNIQETRAFSAINLGQGQYEGRNLENGTYTVSIEKEGYEKQARVISVTAGETAAAVQCVLPHFIVAAGSVTDGKGNGVSDATVEFEMQQTQVVMNDENSGEIEQPVRPMNEPIHTDINGHFRAMLLVKQPGEQRIQVTWNTHYVKQVVFPLPEQPDANYTLGEEIRLPINFIPFRITNVLDQGLPGVEIRLQRTEPNAGSSEQPLLAHAIGNGAYEARELLDGAYAISIHKEGYQDAAATIAVSGGQLLAEQHVALPHYATLRGTIVNSKGRGVAGADMTLAGLNSQRVRAEEKSITDADGNFQINLVVTGAQDAKLHEHLDVAWTNPDPASSDADNASATPYTLAYDFTLPAAPRDMNVGWLHLPANFVPVAIQDVAGRGLSGVNVTFTDEQNRTFTAAEIADGLYEGQNLPDGVYVVQVSKEGYREDSRKEVIIGNQNGFAAPIAFELPHYVAIDGIVANGKGQALTSNMTLELLGRRSTLLPDSVSFDQQGHFTANLLVTGSGEEQIRLVWNGEQGIYERMATFIVPETPEKMDFHRLTLPINFIPIEVKDLLGNGLTNAVINLTHIESSKNIAAKEFGNGNYEGENLLNGSYKISIAQKGYKSSEDRIVTVHDGIVSETQSFTLPHYVTLTGIAIDGDGEGVRDPILKLEQMRSVGMNNHSDVTGKFEMTLEVREVGSERLTLSWKNQYQTSVVFPLPGQPETKDLGDIRLPVNYLSMFVTDISGSTLPNVEVMVENASKTVQTLKTDQNGFCKTDDVPDGIYTLSVNKPGYRGEKRDIRLIGGQNATARFTLPHYVLVQGTVKDVRGNPVGGVDVIFEEFTDENGQQLRTATEATAGKFEQQLLIKNPKFLERQKGHFLLKKGAVEQRFSFKIPTTANQSLRYPTLLFPRRYLYGKVVESGMNILPVANAKISLTYVSQPADGKEEQASESPAASQETAAVEDTIFLTTNSLGIFEIGDLQDGEYKINIQKDGYVTLEDFVRIADLLQEREFTLEKQ